MDYPVLDDVFALDLENEDRGLATGYGPGWAFPSASDRGGKIVGIAVADRNIPQGRYFPIRHEGGDNIDPDTTLRWLADQIAKSKRVITANSQYEIGWCKREGIDLQSKRTDDVLVQAALVWEHDYDYGLDAVAWKYLKRGKKEEELIQAIAPMIRGKITNARVKANIWRLPGLKAGPYACEDAALALDLDAVLQPIIEEQELRTVYDLEMDLMPYLVQMRWNGVRVDLNRAEKIANKFLKTEEEIIAELKFRFGYEFKPSDPKTAAPILREIGINPPKTPKTGKDSVKQAWLDSLEGAGDVPEMLIRCRKAWKARTTFIESYIQDYSYKGRIHGSLNSVKGEAGGTIGGRFSANDPNLQNLPARDSATGPLVRSAFVPEEEDQYWAAIDYSSQEPRLTVHFAAAAGVRGGRAIANEFLSNPKTDLHRYAADIMEMERGDVKQINLGLVYGLGGAGLCHKLGLSTEWIEIRGSMVEVAGPEGKALLAKYHDKMPFINGIIRLAKQTAQRRGYVKTLLGRRCRFPEISPGVYDWIHKALNRIIQGSAADFTKKAMLDLGRQGVLPLVTVHDELGFSVKNKEQAVQYAEVMNAAIPLEIPMLADIEIGVSWGKSMKEWKPEYDIAA